MILAGVKAVTVHDTADVRIQDLSTQFYLSEASVGANRASACQDKLQELNTAVAVSASTADLTEQFVSQYQVLWTRDGPGNLTAWMLTVFRLNSPLLLRLCVYVCVCFFQVVVCTNTMMKESIVLNEICHKLSIGFIKADIYGAFANVFCDFGKGFHVLDVDGESPISFEYRQFCCFGTPAYSALFITS